MHWAEALNILQIIIIDIVLSGDNAVVIALAAHRLPEHQRKRAILWGGGIAIGMRIAFTMLMAFLLMVPGVRLVGGLVLVWIACKLLLEEEEEEVSADNVDKSTLAAIRMIFLADFVMSLDNMLAVAGASHGNWILLLFGLFVSITIIMTCSALIARLMNRFHWIVYVGAAILAWTAGEMIVGDRELASYFVKNHHVVLSNHWDEWKETRGDVAAYPVDELPETVDRTVDGTVRSEPLRKLVHHRPPHPDGWLATKGRLTFVGQMSEAQRDELLKHAPAEEDRAAIEGMYETAREQPIPEWVPEGMRKHVYLWFQSRWPAEYWDGVQHHYPWVAWIVQSLVVLLCLTSPRWLGKHKEKPEAENADGPSSNPA